MSVEDELVPWDAEDCPGDVPLPRDAEEPLPEDPVVDPWPDEPELYATAKAPDTTRMASPCNIRCMENLLVSL